MSKTFKVYTQPDCLYCRKAKLLLQMNGHEIQEVDITKVDGARELVRDYFNFCGVKPSTPLIVDIDDGYIIGSYEGLERYLNNKL